nr:hypothetical protein [Tanacetum cinerariifolium]
MLLQLTYQKWNSKRSLLKRWKEITSTPSEKATKGAGGSTTGSQSRQQSAIESAYAEEPVQTTCQMEETSLPVYETGADDQPIVQTSQHPKWFSQPRKPPSPDRAWNTALPAAQGDAQTWISDLAKQADARLSFNDLLETPIDFSNFIMHRLNVHCDFIDVVNDPKTRGVIAQGDAQSWISDLAKQADARLSFNELLDIPIDFSNFIMHRLNVDTLTLDLLAGPTYELMRGSCSSLIELEYHLEEVYKATTDQLD